MFNQCPIHVCEACGFGPKSIEPWANRGINQSIVTSRNVKECFGWVTTSSWKKEDVTNCRHILELPDLVTISLDPKVQYLYLESTLGKINSVRIANVNEARQSGAPKWAKQRWSWQSKSYHGGLWAVKLGNLSAALPSFPPKNRARMLYLRGNLCSLQSLVSEQ